MLSLTPRRKKVPFQSVFRTSCCLRWVPISSTSDCTLFEATIRLRLLRPGYSLTTPYSGFVNRLQNSSFPPCLLSKLRGSDFFPGRLASFLLNISALSGRTRTPRSAPCLSKKGIAPSRREGVLTPRCRAWEYLPSPCPLCEILFFFIGPAELKFGVPRVPREPCRPESSRQAFFSLFSVFSVPSVRTLFLIFGTNENRGIAPSRKEKALTPRCRAWEYLPSPRSLCSLREPSFSFKPCQLESWRSQKTYQTEVWRSQGALRRCQKGAPRRSQKDLPD